MGPYGPRRGRWRWIVLAVSLVLIAVVAAFVLWQWQAYESAPAGHRPYFFWPFGTFLLVFLVLWVAFFAIRMTVGSRRAQRWEYARPTGGYRDRAVMIARRRYAQGEITRDQYDRLMTDLTRRPPGPGG